MHMQTHTAIFPVAHTGPEVTNYQEMMKIDFRRQELLRLQGQLREEKEVIHLRGMFKLTKTERSHCEVYFLRDLALERQVMETIEKRVSHETLMKRYQAYDPSVDWCERPHHYAVRILAGTGSFACGSNIFAFFPEALSLLPRKSEEVFGLEFIDVWENIFRRSIFPCLRKIFDIPTQIKVTNSLASSLPQTIYLAAYYHEVGHRSGPWRVSPRPNPRLNLTGYHWGIMGEIATDSQLITTLREFPEIALFVTLARLFWFGRRGFLADPIRGLLNVDNDAWLGSFVFARLAEQGALYQNSNGTWALDFERVGSTFASITEEIDALAAALQSTDGTPNEGVDTWMKTRVPWAPEFGFMFPTHFRAMLSELREIPEQPVFSPPVDLNRMASFSGAPDRGSMADDRDHLSWSMDRAPLAASF
jgi:hypothetical protein